MLSRMILPPFVLGGGTNIFPALALAYESLQDINTKFKHIILLTDGQSATSGDYYFLARRMEKQRITMSTVAVGQGADVSLLEMLAEWGRGRYYFTDDSFNIPRIFTKETMMALRSYLVEEEFTPHLVNSSPVLKGIDGVPSLNGYVATTPKDTARTVLASHKGDPVLAHWQYGLGRSVAFTSDAGGRWAEDWIKWAGYNQFWGNIISWALPRHLDEALTLETSVEGGEGVLRVDSTDLSAASVTTTANVVDPGLKSQVLHLTPVLPGKYEGTFKLEQPGVYLINVTRQQGGQPADMVKGGLALSYSPEYRYAGSDAGYLKRLAGAGGGSLLTRPEEAFADNLPEWRGEIELWPWLLLLAVLLLPLDIAARRLNFSAGAISEGYKRVWNRLQTTPPAPETPTIFRLREKKQEWGNQRRPQRATEPVATPPPSLGGERPAQVAEPEKSSRPSGKQPEAPADFTSRLLEAKKRTKK